MPADDIDPISGKAPSKTWVYDAVKLAVDEHYFAKMNFRTYGKGIHLLLHTPSPESNGTARKANASFRAWPVEPFAPESDTTPTLNGYLIGPPLKRQSDLATECSGLSYS